RTLERSSGIPTETTSRRSATGRSDRRRSRWVSGDRRNDPAAACMRWLSASSRVPAVPWGGVAAAGQAGASQGVGEHGVGRGAAVPPAGLAATVAGLAATVAGLAATVGPAAVAARGAPSVHLVQAQGERDALARDVDIEYPRPDDVTRLHDVT